MGSDQVVADADPPARADEPPERRRELDRLRTVAFDVLLFRVVFLAVAWLARWMLEGESIRPDFGLDHWRQWDTRIYLDIVERGYDQSVADGNVVGFFPGLPLTTRLVSFLTGTGPLVAGLVVTTLATLLAAYYLHRLAEHDGHRPDRAVLALLLFPTAVFLVAPYTESLFLAGAVPAFYYARRDRPWGVLLFGALACFARAVGPFLVLGVLVELLRRRNGLGQLRDLRRVGTLVAVGAGSVLPFVVHNLVFAEREGTLLSYYEAQGRVTGRGLHDPVDGFLTTADTWWSGLSANNAVTFQLEIVFAALIVALLGWLVRRREWGYVAFVLPLFLVTVTSAYWLSIPRVALTMFPFAFLVADLSEHPRLDGRLLPVMGAVSMLGVMVFVRGAWFF